MKNSAIGSVAWLGTGWAIGLIAFVTVGGVGGSGGGCQGGPDPFNPDDSYVSSDDVHWTAIVPCRDGGHMSRPARPGDVPG